MPDIIYIFAEDEKTNITFLLPGLYTYTREIGPRTGKHLRLQFLGFSRQESLFEKQLIDQVKVLHMWKKNIRKAGNR